jgi:hypothetical protein
LKTFDNEWVCQAFESHASFFTKRMFGGLAIYLFGRQMMILVEPTKTGRWNWHGVLICTEHAHQQAILRDFPHLVPHEVLKKWLFIDSRHDDFESTMNGVAQAIAQDDPRFGIRPRTRTPKKNPPEKRKTAPRKKI